jgi:hypothetical protein
MDWVDCSHSNISNSNSNSNKYKESATIRIVCVAQPIKGQDGGSEILFQDLNVKRGQDFIEGGMAE